MNKNSVWLGLVVILSVGVLASIFPEPFVVGGAGDFVIVYGEEADLSDETSATSILDSLKESLPGDVEIGEDSYKFEKTSNKLNLGEYLADFDSVIDEDNLPVLLKDGEFTDSDNDDFDYEQKIIIDSSVGPNYPTSSGTAFKVSANADVLQYVIEFSDEPDMDKLEESDLWIMGKKYHILDVTDDEIVLLDSSEGFVVGEDSPISALGKEVFIEYVGQNTTKLSVDGEITDILEVGETYKLNDDYYVGIEDILYSSKENGISKVEFSIGNGKIAIPETEREIKVNNEVSYELLGSYANVSGKLENITITWKADSSTLYVKEGNVETMPVFENLNLFYDKNIYPKEEEVNVTFGEYCYFLFDNFPLYGSEEDIYLLYGDRDAGTFTDIGKSSSNILRTSSGSSVTFVDSSDKYAVVSWSDTESAESYLVQALHFRTEDGRNFTTIQYREDGLWVDAKVDVEEGDTFSIGSAELEVGVIDVSGLSVVINRSNSNTNFNMLYTKEGLSVHLPYENDTFVDFLNNTETTSSGACLWKSLGNGEFFTGTIQYNNSGTAANTTCSYEDFDLVFVEEDEDGNMGAGENITFTLGWNTESPKKTSVSDVSVSSGSSLRGVSDDVYRTFVYSSLASEVYYDQTLIQKTARLIYHGGEAVVDAYIGSGEGIVSFEQEVEDSLIKDNEFSKSENNLIVVGGSCVNSIAADLLGGAYCGSAFTEATGVEEGEFFIKKFEDSDISDKAIILIAGYDAEDTAKGVEYFLNNNIDVETFKFMIG